jgi:cell division protein ZapE
VSRAADRRDIPPGRAYAEGVSAGRWQDDPAQRAALREFDRIFHALHPRLGSGLLDRLRARLAPPPLPRGLYLWGGVGRGKTFLVDLFFEHLPGTAKRRVHFHRFMGEVHGRLKALGETRDPLVQVAADIAAEARVLCLDEFFVSDIGDAMILARLLERLFEEGVVLVTTSNTVPDQLYRDGLQRTRFLPAIALLNRHCAVHFMESSTDYRLRTLSQAQVYLQPLSGRTQATLQRLYEQLTCDTLREGAPLSINGRLIPTIDYCEGVAWLDYQALCEGPRSVADYIEIARDFHTVLLAQVPQFDASMDNQARRFVHLVDEFYDRNVNLILSAAVPLTELYRGDKLHAEFERTESRLIEMQSEAYLARAHRP